MCKRILYHRVLGVLCGLVLSTCATKEKKPEHDSVASDHGSDKDKHEGDSELSGNRHSFINSFSNNGLTSHAVNKTKVSDKAASLEKSAKDSASMAGLISANRLAGKGYQESLPIARGIIDAEVRRGGVQKELPEAIQLELALSALTGGHLAFAEFYFDHLTKSKSPSIRAAAHNAIGVVAVKMDRLPEAVLAFREALKAEENFGAARLNLGFLALLGGDFATAKKMLAGMQDDWFVQYGMVTIDRIDGDAGKAEGLCDKVQQVKPQHKPTLFNCGLNAYQGKHDVAKAKALINKMLKTPGGSQTWDDKAARLLGAIDAEEARRQAAQDSEKKKPQGGEAKSTAPSSNMGKEGGAKAGEKPKSTQPSPTK